MMYSVSKIVKRLLPVTLLLALCGLVYAEGGVPENTITGRAVSVKGDIMSIVSLVGAISSVAGVAFFMMTFLKFKQFKDNPQQTPVGTPVLYLFISVMMVYLGNSLFPIGETLFGKDSDSLRTSETEIERIEQSI